MQLKIKDNQLIISSDELPKDVISSFGRTIGLPYANIIITKNKEYNSQSTKNVEDVSQLELYISSLDTKVNSMQKLLRAELTSKETTVIRLSMNYAEIQKAKDILNALIIAYNNDAIQDKNSESTKTLVFIEDRIKNYLEN